MTSEYIPRLVDPLLSELEAELPAVMLVGPRACGKTTTALRRARSVLRLDRPGQAASFLADPDLVLAAQGSPVLIDEWQSVPESLGAVKRAVDAGAASGSFIVTGSVRARRSPQAWPATGRVIPIAMFGLTQGELEGALGGLAMLESLFAPHPYETGPVAQAPTLVDYVDMAVRGGFPAAVSLGARGRSLWFDGYLEQLVHRDALELADIKGVGALGRLLSAVGVNTAGLPTLSALADAAQLDQRTVRSYLDLLEDLRIIERLPAWGINRFTRAVKAPKYHIVDPGMAVHLMGDNAAGLLTDGSRLGRVVETFAVAQLRPLLRLARPAIHAFHFRDDGGRREVDLVLENAAGKVVGLEVKASSAVTARDARHLAWLRDSLGSAFVRGAVLHTGDTVYPLGERLWAVPIAWLWRSGTASPSQET